MASIIITDPGTSEAKSPLIAGITEGLNKISSILNLQTNTAQEVTLINVPITETDKNRIYQAPNGNRLWVSDPEPVIRKNGQIITQETDGFEIDYVGGSVSFPDNQILYDDDVLTASFTYIVGISQKINGIENNLSSVSTVANHYRGVYADKDALTIDIPTAKNGDYAIVLDGPAIYVWKDTIWDSVTSKNVGNVVSDYGAEIEFGNEFSPESHTIKFTTDPVPSGDIGFNNSTSGLTAITLQNAIDELAELYKNVKTTVDNIVLNNSGSHNSIYRGKNLGTSVTSDQYFQISQGTFGDLYIGDYWVINNVTYRIAAFDYYLRCGDIDLTTHHVVIVPDLPFYNASMNDTNVTTGGYLNSKMRTTNLQQAINTIKVAFNNHVLKHRLILTSKISNGIPSDSTWTDSEVDLMNEQMVYGSSIFMPGSSGSSIAINIREDKSQLPLFAHRPDLISNRSGFWLRDSIVTTYFSAVGISGIATAYPASQSVGVRPAFCIC